MQYFKLSLLTTNKKHQKFPVIVIIKLSTNCKRNDSFHFLAFYHTSFQNIYEQITCQDTSLSASTLVDIYIVIQSWQIATHTNTLRQESSESSMWWGEMISMLFLEHGHLLCCAKTFTFMWLTYMHTPSAGFGLVDLLSTIYF